MYWCFLSFFVRGGHDLGFTTLCISWICYYSKKQWRGTTLCFFMCFPSRPIKCCVLLQTSALLSLWNWWACCRRRDSPPNWSQSTHSFARSWCSFFPRWLLKNVMKCALMDDMSVWIQVCISIFNLFLITDCPHLPSAALTFFFFKGAIQLCQQLNVALGRRLMKNMKS